jgi:hypothetical protein
MIASIVFANELAANVVGVMATAQRLGAELRRTKKLGKRSD